MKTLLARVLITLEDPKVFCPLQILIVPGVMLLAIMLVR